MALLLLLYTFPGIARPKHVAPPNLSRDHPTSERTPVYEWCKRTELCHGECYKCHFCMYVMRQRGYNMTGDECYKLPTTRKRRTRRTTPATTTTVEPFYTRMVTSAAATTSPTVAISVLLVGAISTLICIFWNGNHCHWYMPAPCNEIQKHF